MVVIWGTTHAGKTDEVPGMFHVVTQFGHLYYIPIIPTGSYVVLEKHADGGFQGASIPLSMKSWLVAWLRAGCILGFIAAVIGGAVSLAEFQKNPAQLGWVGAILGGIVALVVLFLSYKLKAFTHASYERAVYLGKYIGLTEMGMLMIEVAYGRLSPEQADAELARIDQQVYEAQLADQGNSVV